MKKLITQVTLAIVLAVFAVCCLSCRDAKKHERNITTYDLEKLVSRLQISNTKELDTLTAAIDQNAEQDIVTLMHLKRDVNEPDRAKVAAYLILAAENLSVKPLLDSIDANDPVSLDWSLRAITDAHQNQTKRIAAQLEKLLTDKREIFFPKPKDKLEEEPPRVRVCDDAYVLLRRFFYYVDPNTIFEEERMFLQREFEDRDKEIERFKSSKVWKSFAPSSESAMGN